VPAIALSTPVRFADGYVGASGLRRP
jgi:hypothetical protein